MSSCSQCPSFMDAEAARGRFGRPIGAPMCGRHGYVLGHEGQASTDAHNTLAAFAMECPDYGDPLPGKPVSLRPRVSTVSEQVIEDGPTGLEVGSCHACTNCVKHTTVYNEWHWPLPLCRAKGTLIFDPTRENKGCDWASPGASSENLFGVELRKEFRDGFTIDSERAVDNLTDNGNLSVDPRLYETDSPVDPADAEDGIRAWRKLTCPFGTQRTIYLPIFDSSENGIFSEHERSQIPQIGDENHPELYVDYAHLVWRFAVEEWQLGQTLMVQSFPGLGKTQLAYYLGWLMQAPVTRLFFTDSIEWDDIFGKVGFGGGETFWADGRFTAAIRRPGIVLVDEPNLAKSEIVATLRTTTENDPTLYIDASYGRSEEDRINLQVRPNRYNFRIWCSNPSWDPKNIGTKELAAADISRLSPAYLDYPPSVVEKHIVLTTVKELDGWVVPDDLLEDLMKVSTDIRAAVENGDFPGTWGVRENVKVARKLAWYPFVEAFRMAQLNYYEPETSEFIIANSIKTIRPDDIN